MTPNQKLWVREKLVCFKAAGAVRFHHGACIGSDEQAARIAKDLGYYIVAHPGYNPRNPEGRMYRSNFVGNDEVREEKPFIARDHDIVDETDHMIATPISEIEEVRSGTWSTIRFARKHQKPIEIVYPDPEEK